jgi:hypothetical protein
LFVERVLSASSLDCPPMAISWQKMRERQRRFGGSGSRNVRSVAKRSERSAKPGEVTIDTEVVA